MLQGEWLSTLAQLSIEDVRTLHVGNKPTPHTMSVIGSVWSDSMQYGVGASFCRSSSKRLQDTDILSNQIGPKRRE